jgi:hypothetical protein
MKNAFIISQSSVFSNFSLCMINGIIVLLSTNQHASSNFVMLIISIVFKFVIFSLLIFDFLWKSLTIHKSDKWYVVKKSCCLFNNVRLISEPYACDRKNKRPDPCFTLLQSCAKIMRLFIFRSISVITSPLAPIQC